MYLSKYAYATLLGLCALAFHPRGFRDQVEQAASTIDGEDPFGEGKVAGKDEKSDDSNQDSDEGSEDSVQSMSDTESDDDNDESDVEDVEGGDEADARWDTAHGEWVLLPSAEMIGTLYGLKVWGEPSGWRTHPINVA